MSRDKKGMPHIKHDRISTSSSTGVSDLAAYTAENPNFDEFCATHIVKSGHIFNVSLGVSPYPEPSRVLPQLGNPPI
jgi:hypothetical protein